MTEHPVNGLDDVVHQRVRLGVLAVTHEAKRVEFGFLRQTLDVTPGNLSQHLTILERAGLVTTEKGGRVRTCKLGRRRFEAETAWLERYHQVWDARFDELDKVVEELKRKENIDGHKKRE